MPLFLSGLAVACFWHFITFEVRKIFSETSYSRSYAIQPYLSIIVVSVCAPKGTFWIFSEKKDPKNTPICHLDTCGSVPNVRTYFLLSLRMYMTPIGTIVRHA